MTDSFSFDSLRLQLLERDNAAHLIAGGLKGIEKESLRIGDDGRIAATSHPKSLGSALTHQHITTDYSEALMEFITPPSGEVGEVLSWLYNIHQFVYDNLQDEILLSASMPCGIDGDNSIPIAEYGLSNIGRMKHIYRRGLAYRYGRSMQAIAGIHFNYSVPMPLWRRLHALEGSTLPLESYISESYFAMIRNILRHGWLILYLFGASPAICKSFFKSRPELMAQFDEFDAYTLYHPYATSLRMSDIGYKSENQARLEIDYNSPGGYVASLSHAIETPYPPYQAIGVLVDGEYRQLNDNILQIENEFYSTVRPKQIIYSGEKPTLALKRRGVRYVELRSLDLDPEAPLGIEPETACFLEAFMITCLMLESPLFMADSRPRINRNQLAVAHRGREPGLMLETESGKAAVRDWARAFLEAMKSICVVLDQSRAGDDDCYQAALAKQEAKVMDANSTPSANMLKRMRDSELPFNPHALALSKRHAQGFRERSLPTAWRLKLELMAEASLTRQAALEQENDVPFAEFLARYFAQC